MLKWTGFHSYRVIFKDLRVFFLRQVAERQCPLSFTINGCISECSPVRIMVLLPCVVIRQQQYEQQALIGQLSQAGFRPLRACVGHVAPEVAHHPCRLRGCLTHYTSIMDYVRERKGWDDGWEDG